MKLFSSEFTKKKFSRHIFVLIVLPFFVACTKGVPQVEGLANKVDALKITDGAIAVTSHNLSGSSTETFTGTCWNSVDKLFITDPQTLEWLPVSSVAESGSDVDCSDGVFSVIVNTASGRFFYDKGVDLVADSKIGFRATTSQYEFAEYFVSLEYFASTQLSFDVITESLTEGQSFNMTIRLNRAALTDTSFDLSLSGSTAPFTFNSGMVIGTHTIPSGQTSISLSFVSTDDPTPEAHSSGTITISNPSAGVTISPARQALAIDLLDDDIGLASVTGIEGPADSIADLFFNGTTAPEFTWNHAPEADQYLISIRLVSATVCGPITVTVPVAVPTDFTESFPVGCSLTPGQTYNFRIDARRGALSRILDSTFSLNTPPEIYSSVARYVMESEGNYSLPLSYIGEDADSGDTITVTNATAAAGTVSYTSSNVLFDTSSTGVFPVTITLADARGGVTTGVINFHSVTPFTWTGTSSNDWNTVNNWCGLGFNPTRTACIGSGSLPANIDVVTIDQTCVSPTCNPLINSGNFDIRGLNIHGGRTLTLDSSGVTHLVGTDGIWIENGTLLIQAANTGLNIEGPLDVKGIFRRTASGMTRANSRVESLPGSTFQHIDGTFYIQGVEAIQQVTAATPMEFKYLDISKGEFDRVDMSGTFRVSETFVNTAKIHSPLPGFPRFEIAKNMVHANGYAKMDADSVVVFTGNGNFAGPSSGVGTFGTVGKMMVAGATARTYSNRVRILKSASLPTPAVAPTIGSTLELLGTEPVTTLDVATANNLEIKKTAGNVVIDNTITVANMVTLDFKSAASLLNRGTGAGVIEIGQSLSTSGLCVSEGGDATLRLLDTLNASTALNLYYYSSGCVLPNLEIVNTMNEASITSTAPISIAGDFRVSSADAGDWALGNNNASYAFIGSTNSTIDLPLGIRATAMTFQKTSANLTLLSDLFANDVRLKMRCASAIGGELNGHSVEARMNLIIDDTCGGTTNLTLKTSGTAGFLTYGPSTDSSGTFPGTYLNLDANSGDISFSSDLNIPDNFNVNVFTSVLDSVFLNQVDMTCGPSSFVNIAPGSNFKLGAYPTNLAPSGTIIGCSINGATIPGGP